MLAFTSMVIVSGLQVFLLPLLLLRRLPFLLLLLRRMGGGVVVSCTH